MSYLALYRKFRPSTFDEVIGQEHITTSLKNQITLDAVSHAYLFCGTRGTGKTSVAKILAKSINCEKSKNGIHCGKCATCVALADVNNLDIMEIDAASNNRVDEIRELREKVKYPPVNGKYKVYIIDEVHMLTDSAFNALLKTLEEPPAHVVFILATTEVQKLPATILSRCVRFDFKLVSQPELQKHLANIFTKTQTKYEEEALALIARLGEGSVRDTLSIADMCVAYTNKNVTYDSVLNAVGAIDKNILLNLSAYILIGDVANTLTQINQIAKNGKSITQLSKDMANYFRDLAVIKTCPDAQGIVNYPQEFLTALNEVAKASGIENILLCLKTFSSLENEFRFTNNPRLVFEVNSLNLCDEFSGKVKSTSPKVMDTTAVIENTVTNLQPTNITSEKTIFGKLIVELRESNETMLIALIGENVVVEFDNNQLSLTTSNKTEFNMLNKPTNMEILNKAIAKVDLQYSVVVKYKEEVVEKTVEELLKEKFGKDLKIK